MGQNDSTGRMFTQEQVSDALNSAADDLLDRLDAGSDGARDLANLLVNTGLYYLTNPDNRVVDDAILANYDPEDDDEDDDEGDDKDDSDTRIVNRVLGWAAACV